MANSLAPSCEPDKGYDHKYENTQMNRWVAALAGASNLEALGTEHVQITNDTLVLQSSKCRDCPFHTRNAEKNGVKACYPAVKRIGRVLRSGTWYHISPSITTADVK